MTEKKLSQEMLKIIACFTMLLDHIGAIFYPGSFTLRIIGRIAFPIYCFLLVEGAHYTKNPNKYGIRLAIGLILSEIPFDLAFRRSWIVWNHQSVMVTLLLGFLAIEIIERTDNDLIKLIISGIFFYLAEAAHTDYGGYGVLLIILFSQTRGKPWLQTLLLLLVAWMMNSLRIKFLGLRIPIELFAVLAMVPIALYSGKKATSNKAIQWGFYLFYPLHLALLCLIRFFLK